MVRRGEDVPAPLKIRAATRPRSTGRSSWNQCEIWVPRLTLQDLAKGLADACRGFGNHDPGRLHGLDLVLGAASPAGDDGAGVAHAAAGRRGPSGDEPDGGLVASARRFFLEKVGRIFLG